ncbi:hypothetical protein E4U53_002881, partial [Claviceps sorghi]
MPYATCLITETASGSVPFHSRFQSPPIRILLATVQPAAVSNHHLTLSISAAHIHTSHREIRDNSHHHAWTSFASPQTNKECPFAWFHT